MKAYIYARGERQDTVRQITSLSKLASSMGYKDMGTYWCDDYFNHKGLQQWLRRAVDDGIDMIFFSDMSKCGRHIWEVQETIKFCIEHRINLHFKKENITLYRDGQVDNVMAIYVKCLEFCAKIERESIRCAKIEIESTPFVCAEVVKALRRGLSIRDTAKVCGVYISTVKKIKEEFAFLL